MGRFWVDGEREGKFGGKSGKKSEKMGCSFGFCFQILKFLNFFIFFFFKKKNVKNSEMALST
jgi:hypothetical protein